MKIEKAKEIVALLANGTDPTTGEVFVDGSPYNHPLVIRALFTVLNHVKIPKKQHKLSIEEKQAKNIVNGKPRNSELAWTEELKQEVGALFGEGKSIRELAQYFERTEGAIFSELVHQGIIEQDEKKSYS